VSRWAFADYEPGGDDEKLWLEEPGSGVRWLFKPVVKTAERRQGEDSAEKVVAAVATLLHVPAAHIELATRRQEGETRDGCISRSVRPSGWQSHTGAVLLTEVVEDFDVKDPDRRGHTLANIARVLEGYGAPPDFDGPADFDAFDVFAGYLLLDACVANQDRHSQNWSVLFWDKGDRKLMASYDHASSLGFQLTDARRELILSGKPGIPVWSGRGGAQRFEGGRSVTLVGHALAGLDMVRPHLLVCWQHPGTRRYHAVGLLSGHDDHYEYAYLRRVDDIAGFEPLPGFSRTSRRYRSAHLFPLFAERVMDPVGPTGRRGNLVQVPRPRSPTPGRRLGKDRRTQCRRSAEARGGPVEPRERASDAGPRR
jgi:hypothetical protein